MAEIYISRIELKGIHKRYNLEVDFNESLNILYGKNGTGKSTLLHIIANIANCDFIRFAFLDFESIKLVYSSQRYILITQSDGKDDVDVVIYESLFESDFRFSRRQAYEALREMEDETYGHRLEPELTLAIRSFVKENEIKTIATSYFPAFRAMLEAWSSQRAARRIPPGRRNRDISVRQATDFSRNIFGEFRLSVELSGIT